MKICIVTPSLNQREFLSRTAASILSQSGDFELQWIVIDGGSTDGTLEFLSTLRDPRISFVSEPDRGQAHAINKGLKRAAADVVAYLNADDLYCPGALHTVAKAFADHDEAKWIVGRCRIIDADDRPIRSSITRYKDLRLRRYSYRRLLRENFISQPAVFWRSSFGQTVGPLDESLHWTMDYDLWLRMGRLIQPLVLDEQLASFRIHSESKSGQVDRRQFDEGYRVACQYCDQHSFDLFAHRFNIEKIVLAYRVMALLRQ